MCERVLILRAGRLAVDSRLHELQRDGALLVAVDGDGERTLHAVDGVEKVSELESSDGQRRYRVQAQPGSAPRVAQAVMNAGLALHELTPERHDLETVFTSINEEVNHG